MRITSGIIQRTAAAQAPPEFGPAAFDLNATTRNAEARQAVADEVFEAGGRTP